MIHALAVWVLPWYALGFVLLAFLPRWHWLLPGGLLALAFSIFHLRRLAHDTSEGAEMGSIMTAYVAVGFASGFLARTVVLADISRNGRLRHSVIILPSVFVAGLATLFVYLWIR